MRGSVCPSKERLPGVPPGPRIRFSAARCSMSRATPASTATPPTKIKSQNPCHMRSLMWPPASSEIPRKIKHHKMRTLPPIRSGRGLLLVPHLSWDGRVDNKFDKMAAQSPCSSDALAMNEEPTTAIIQRYLDALPGDSAAEPPIRELLERAVGRLRLLCAGFLHKSYPRLTRPPVNLEADELLGGVVAGLLMALRTTRPPAGAGFSPRRTRTPAGQRGPRARHLEERPAAAAMAESGVAASPSSTASGLSPDGRHMLEVIEGLPEDEREVFDLARL